MHHHRETTQLVAATSSNHLQDLFQELFLLQFAVAPVHTGFEGVLAVVSSRSVQSTTHWWCWIDRGDWRGPRITSSSSIVEGTAVTSYARSMTTTAALHELNADAIFICSNAPQRSNHRLHQRSVDNTEVLIVPDRPPVVQRLRSLLVCNFSYINRSL